MTNLECTVKTCTHNENNCCCLQQIEVSGKGALNSDMTCCSSFAENKGTAKNAYQGEPERATGIRCDVENCAYNERHVCTAAAVDITGCNACNCGQTECATFKQK